MPGDGDNNTSKELVNLDLEDKFASDSEGGSRGGAGEGQGTLEFELSRNMTRQRHMTVLLIYNPPVPTVSTCGTDMYVLILQ